MNRRSLLLALTSNIIYPISSPVWSAHQKTALALNGYQFEYGSEVYQLADVISPTLDELHPNNTQYANYAKIAFGEVLQNSNYTIHHLKEKNRWGIKIVRLPIVEGRIAIEEYCAKTLLINGHMRVHPHSDDEGIIQEFLKLEDKARTQKIGLWSLKWYRVRDANTLNDARDSIGGMHLFAGVIKKVGRYKGRWFLNFGDQYSDDVTATIAPREARKWLKNGFDFNALEGQRVRFRGYAEWINGPSIALSHPQALEIL